MTDTSEFKPPKPSLAFIRLCELAFPIYLKLKGHLSFEFRESSNHPLKLLKGKPTIVVMNHSDKQDPLVVIALAKYMREPVYCVVAREVFDWNHGVLGWLFQRFGCYSVNRGGPDFRSIHTTQKILMHFHRKLILFPEGEVTGDDLSVHEINRALIHVVLNMQKEMAKGKSPQSIWILPVGVSYRLKTSLEASVNKTLTVIEHRLNIVHAPHADPETRARLAMDALLGELSRSYEFLLMTEQPQHAQVLSLAKHICERISKYGGWEHEPNASTEQVLYSLRNHINEKLRGRPVGETERQNSPRATSTVYRKFLLDLDRVERLLIVHRVLKQPTSEIQICRTVDFLESEKCGRMTSKGRQCASVFVGKPVEVLHHLETYESRKELAIDELTASIREELQSALDSSHKAGERGRGDRYLHSS